MYYTDDNVKATDLPGDAWWCQIVLKPFVNKMVWVFANYTKFTPNQITIMSFLFGILSAFFFLRNYLIIGALIFEFSFILDCVDGKLARLKGLQSKFGGYLDTISDITKYFLIVLFLVYGQYLLTKDLSYFFYGYIFIFLEFIAITHVYIVPNKPEKKEAGELLDNRLHIVMKIKRFIDPKNILPYTVSSVDAETMTFFISPILLTTKLGFIIGSIILIICILSLTVFHFFIKSNN